MERKARSQIFAQHIVWNAAHLWWDLEHQHHTHDCRCYVSASHKHHNHTRDLSWHIHHTHNITTAEVTLCAEFKLRHFQEHFVDCYLKQSWSRWGNVNIIAIHQELLPESWNIGRRTTRTWFGAVASSLPVALSHLYQSAPNEVFSWLAQPSSSQHSHSVHHTNSKVHDAFSLPESLNSFILPSWLWTGKTNSQNLSISSPQGTGTRPGRMQAIQSSCETPARGGKMPVMKNTEYIAWQICEAESRIHNKSSWATAAAE